MIVNDANPTRSYEDHTKPITPRPRQRQWKPIRSLSAAEIDRRLEKCRLQLTIVAHFVFHHDHGAHNADTGGDRMKLHLPLLVCGVNESRDYDDLQRILANVPTQMEAELQILDSFLDHQDIMQLRLTPESVDSVSKVATNLLLRVKSLGVHGKVVIQHADQIQFVIPSCQLDKNHPQQQQVPTLWRLHWAQIILLDSTSKTVVQTVELSRLLPIKVNIETASCLADQVRNPKALEWLQQNELLRCGDESSRQRHHKTIFILRGMPGSGKSSLRRDLELICTVKQLQLVVCSADLLRQTARGYNYDIEEPAVLHACCRNGFVMALHDPLVDVVIVDNTHTQRWEYEQYEILARWSGVPYDLFVWEIRCTDVDMCKAMARRSAHGVPVAMVLQMFHGFEQDRRAVVFEPNF